MPHRFKGLPGGLLPVRHVSGRELAKIAAQCLEGIALLRNLRLCAEAQAAEDWHRWAPALDGVLEQKSGDDGRKEKELAAHPRPEGETYQDRCGRIGFQAPLNVPFPIKLSQAPVDDARAGTRVPGDVGFGLAANLLVDLSRGMPWDSFDS